MRRASSDYSIIQEEGKFIGISLGADFVSEHEWGIEEMRRKMGMGLGDAEKKFGIERRVITKGNKVTFLKEGNMALLTSYTPYTKREVESIKTLIPYDLKHITDKIPLATAWDSTDFCVVVSGEENIKLLEDLYEQFQKNNIAITTLKGSMPAFSNASLSLLIVDRLPKGAFDSMYQADKKAHDLVEYEEKIGLTKLKKDTRNGYQKEKYYCACSARWIDYENEEVREKYKKENKTKFDIVYWINYSDDDNNYGHYTVEEIEKWLSTPGLKLVNIRKAHGGES